MISIALASYNGAPHLLEQLESLAAQHRPPDELVVSDDGSSDGTQDIVRRFATAAPFKVTLLEQAVRLGFADNFLAAAKACSHEMVAFCDQDDVWLPQKLAAAEVALHRADAALFIHQSQIVDDRLQPIAQLDQRIPRRGLVKPLTLDAYDLGYGHCMMFRRELLQIGDLLTRPAQPRGKGLLAHDHWIMQMASLVGLIVISDENLTLYRQHASNAFGPAVLAPNNLSDFSSPAIADYKAERDFYSEFAEYLAGDAVDDAARALGSLTSGEQVQQQLNLRIHRLTSRIETYTATNLSTRASSLARAIRSGLLTRSVGLGELSLSGGKDAIFGVLAKRPTSR